MPRTLFGRAVAALVALLVALGAVYVLGGWWVSRLYQEEVEQRLNWGLAAHLLEEGPLMEAGEVRQEQLEHLLHMLMVINPRLEIYVLDPAGRIRTFSAEEDKVKLERVDLEPIRAFLAGGERLPIRGDDPRKPGRRKVFSVAPIEGERGLEGYLYVVLGGEHYDSIADRVGESFALRLGGLWALAAMVAVAVVGAMIFYLLTRRLRRLDRKVRSYRQSEESAVGEASQPEPIDELERLEQSLESMQTRIDSQMREVEAMDRHRRELLANVSHDLRTPLAALQGYLETLILKDDALADEQRERYLKMAFRHSQSLGALVDELFELAKLEAGDQPMSLEPIALGELIQDVGEKFRLEAESKRIRLKTRLGEERQPLVRGDIGLLERVLDNLIENAIRYTPEGGEVSIGAWPSNGQVEIRVTDSGRGIAPDDLPRIFDRFFQVEPGEPGEGGTGLGLAIARRIVELHGSEIEVDSELGRGSTFSFRLRSVG